MICTVSLAQQQFLFLSMMYYYSIKWKSFLIRTQLRDTRRQKIMPKKTVRDIRKRWKYFSVEIKNKLGKAFFNRMFSRGNGGCVSAAYMSPVGISTPKCRKCLHNVNAKWYMSETCLPIYWKCLACILAMDHILYISPRKRGDRVGSVSCFHLNSRSLINALQRLNRF